MRNMEDEKSKGNNVFITFLAVVVVLAIIAFVLFLLIIGSFWTYKEVFG